MGIFKKKEVNGSFGASLFHTEGLPIAENTHCELRINEGKLVITGGGSEFIVNLSQIQAADFKTDVEIAHIVNSSAAKGIAGGLLFGPIGLVVGARATSKKERTVTPYLIMNYINSANELAVLMFRDNPKSFEAAKFIDKIRPIISNNPKQTIQL
ncbi:hypothetical protein D3C76_126640 [compost metagenome]|uniref:hypothetical protein n=1 Tax=unclassified Paenibacillus TaxID=185978 RepID=UPI000F9892F7|nr:hypothetical protein [Paenibacillus sp. B2(2019)]KAA1180696.1 hypothetical protein PAENI_25950 [Paenibacillus sp. B2(2019)]